MTIVTEAEFRLLYRSNYQDVVRFVRRRAEDEAVDDIVGETFLTAWRRRGELPTEARPWLFRTARFLIGNTHRGARRRLALADRARGEWSSTNTGGIDFAGMRLDVAAAWAGLGNDEQDVLSLHVWEELSAADAGIVLGCSRAAYAMRLTRAKRRLASLMDQPAATPARLTASF